MENYVHKSLNHLKVSWFTKNILLVVLCLIFIFSLTPEKAKAGPGDSCSSAISIAPSYSLDTIDYRFNDTVVYFTFIADSVNTRIMIYTPFHSTDSTACIQALSLYSGTCSGLTLIGYDSINTCSVDTLPIIISGLTIGTTYYIKVTNTVCGICPLNGYFRIWVKDPPTYSS